MIQSGHKVIGTDGCEWTVGPFCTLPCEQPGCERVHSVLVGDGPKGPRLVRAQGDGPHLDLGPAPFEAPSRHPFLSEALAEGVELARRVGMAIPGWRNTESGLYGIKESDDNCKLEAVVMHSAFNAYGGCSPAADHHVDAIPHSRFVDRLPLMFAEDFGIEPYDDGSGYPGEFSMDIRPDKVFVSYADTDGGALVVSSEIRDGAWTHGLVLEAVEFLEPIEHIRSARDGYVRRAADVIDQNPCFADRKIDRDTLVVVSVEEADGTESPKTRFHIDPASVSYLR